MNKIKYEIEDGQELKDILTSIYGSEKLSFASEFTIGDWQGLFEYFSDVLSYMSSSFIGDILVNGHIGKYKSIEEAYKSICNGDKKGRSAMLDEMSDEGYSIIEVEEGIIAICM